MTSRSATFRDAVILGLILAPLRWVFYAVLLFFGVLIAACIIDWIMVLWVWPEGITRLESLLAHDYRLAMELAALQNGRPEFVSRVANFCYGVVFEATGLHAMGAEFANQAALSIPDSIVRRAYLSSYDVINVVMIGTKLFGVRVAVVLMFTPWFLLLYVVALADGLVQRAIRRASGGRESSSLYHRAKYAWHFCMVAFVLAVVLIPDLPDSSILMALAVVTLLMPARLQWAYYKKHL